MTDETRRAIWLAVTFLAIVIVVSAALAHGFGLHIAKGPA